MANPMAKHYSELSREELDALLEMPCQDAGLSATISGILDNNGIHNLGILLAHTKQQLLTIRDVNQRTIDRIYMKYWQGMAFIRNYSDWLNGINI